ncbi:MAG: hypothetical protein ACREBU_24830 [Nitrososphaera sp.]
MAPIDLITMILLIVVLFLAAIVSILIKRGKLKPVIWPRVFGIGAGVFMFVSSMIASILLRPISEIVDYTVTNFFWSLAMGIVGYFGGRSLARRK